MFDRLNSWNQHAVLGDRGHRMGAALVRLSESASLRVPQFEQRGVEERHAALRPEFPRAGHLRHSHSTSIFVLSFLPVELSAMIS